MIVRCVGDRPIERGEARIVLQGIARLKSRDGGIYA